MADPQTASARQDAALIRLRAANAERLKDLLKRKPGEKHYKRALKDYLEVEGQFEKLLVERAGFH